MLFMIVKRYFSSAEQVHSSLPLPRHFSSQNLKYQDICTHVCFMESTCLPSVKLEAYRVEAVKRGLAANSPLSFLEI